MPHETLLKFTYPQTLIHEYQHWAVLLRPKQVTVGSLVLICTEEATRLPELSAGAFAEMQTATHDLEATLRRVFAFDKINYLCLMMVDPQVHFHVIPRYAQPREVAGKAYGDPFWPGPPDVTKALDLTDEQFASLLALLKSHWPG
ncbi:MAG: HIT family protein [Candidatus Binatia bacterium]